MNVGIIGSESAKFTPDTERAARQVIQRLLSGQPGAPVTRTCSCGQDANFFHAAWCPATPTCVVSGGCHLGGIDAWARQEGEGLGLKVVEFLPKKHNWHEGYRIRNTQIAEASDELHCITLQVLPASYTGMRFKLCYHCGTSDHVKSGGCWTVKYGRKLGKPGYRHVIGPTGIVMTTEM